MILKFDVIPNLDPGQVISCKSNREVQLISLKLSKFSNLEL